MTARHVVEPILSGENKTLKLRFSREDGEGGKIIPFKTDSYHGKQWIEHKNKNVDLAVITLPLFDKILRDSNITFGMYIIDSPLHRYLATKDWIKKYEIKQGYKIFTVGLSPLIYNKDEKNLVLSRFGNIAFLMEKEFSLSGILNQGPQKTYFVDCPSFGGNSGGPVYVYSESSDCPGFFDESRIALLGIMKAFVPSELRFAEVKIQEKDQIKTQDQESKERVDPIPIENTGIGVVIPVDYLVDILFSDELKEARENAVKSLYGHK